MKSVKVQKLSETLGHDQLELQQGGSRLNSPLPSRSPDKAPITISFIVFFLISNLMHVKCNKT